MAISVHELESQAADCLPARHVLTLIGSRGATILPEPPTPPTPPAFPVDLGEVGQSVLAGLSREVAVDDAADPTGLSSADDLSVTVEGLEDLTAWPAY